MVISNIRFSILVPLYNSEEYIEKCISSIINQSYTNFETIIIDDGSTDMSYQLVKSLIDDNDRFKLYTRINKGVFYTRLELINKASGDYIIFLDSDDTLDNNALLKLDHFISKKKSPILIFNYAKYYKNGQISQNNKYSISSGLYKSAFFIDTLLKSDEINSLCMKCVKRDFYQQIEVNRNTFETIIMGEDFLLSLLLFNKCTTEIYITEAILYNVYVHKGSLCASYSIKRLKSDMLLLNTVSQIAHVSKLKYYNGLEQRYNKIIDDAIGMLLFTDKLNNIIIYKYINDLHNFIKKENVKKHTIPKHGRAHKMLRTLIFNFAPLLTLPFALLFRFLIRVRSKIFVS